MRKLKFAAITTAALLLVTGCAGSPDDADGGDGGGAYATDGTFTIAVAGDPGVLNPLNNSSTTSNWLFRFLYDTLVTRGEDGEILSGLATEWSFDGSTAEFTINEDATCYDGSALTPSVIGKNFDYILDPDNPSTVIGSVIPSRDFTYEADDDAGTFTLKLGTPFSLLLSSLSFMPIVCGPDLEDPASITTTSSGSGPFVLESATPNSEYVLTRRDGYTWGSDGASNDVEGFPATVVFKIVDNETTSANLLASGEVNAAVVNGQDRARLEAAGATQTTYTSGGVVQSYNQTEGRVTADPDVRMALAMAFDRGAAAKTVTQGLLPEPGTSVSAAQPQVCEDSAAASSIPEYDPKKAAALLDAAGWAAGSDGIRVKDGNPLTIDAIYSTATPGAAAAAELIASAWKEIGVDVQINPLTQADYSQRVFSTGDYDVVVIQQFSNPFPSTLTGLLGGPFPPDGTNAGHIDNPDYKAAIARAIVSGEDSGCADWTEASAALFTSADMIPISSWPTNWVLKGAEMNTLGGRPIATSIRVLG